MPNAITTTVSVPISVQRRFPRKWEMGLIRWFLPFWGQ